MGRKNSAKFRFKLGNLKFMLEISTDLVAPIRILFNGIHCNANGALTKTFPSECSSDRVKTQIMMMLTRINDFGWRAFFSLLFTSLLWWLLLGKKTMAAFPCSVAPLACCSFDGCGNNDERQII